MTILLTLVDGLNGCYDRLVGWLFPFACEDRNTLGQVHQLVGIRRDPMKVMGLARHLVRQISVRTLCVDLYIV